MKIAVLKSQPRTGMALLLILSSVLLLPAAANGATYRVGPDEQLSKVSEIADKLEAGDVVEITGDITDAFTLTAHGTQDKPITIRGLTQVNGNRILRSEFAGAAIEPSKAVIVCRGDLQCSGFGGSTGVIIWDNWMQWRHPEAVAIQPRV